MHRSCDWENQTHHYEHDTGIAVHNDELEPVNASQAAHDRMQLRKYAQEMEKKWWETEQQVRALETTNEKIRKKLDEMRAAFRQFVGESSDETLDSYLDRIRR